MKEQVINQLKKEFQIAIEHFSEDLKKIQIGRASGSLVEEVMVDSYGSMMPIKNLATISTPDSTTILISPWDKKNIAEIEKAIIKANLGLNPQSEGSSVFIKVPPLTEEKRMEVVKRIHEVAENAKISVRNYRHEAIKKLKNAKNGGDISEDEQKGGENDIQKETDKANEEIESIKNKKEESVKNI